MVRVEHTNAVRITMSLEKTLPLWTSMVRKQCMVAAASNASSWEVRTRASHDDSFIPIAECAGFHLEVGVE